MKVRQATADDADRIAGLMRDSFDPTVLGLTIYGCHGIACYLDARMRMPAAFSDHRHLLALSGRDPAGYAEMRLMADAVCLNYIALAHGRRGRGDADRLLSRCLDLVCEERHRVLMLDVFASNVVSGSWYRKLGFEAERPTAWWSVPIVEPRCAGIDRCTVEGMPEANACQRIYGFSCFTLSTPRANYRIGRLGARWFRTVDYGLLEDSAALASLALLDPARKLLGLFPPDRSPAMHREAEHIDTSLRMRIALPSLRERLEERTGA